MKILIYTIPIIDVSLEREQVINPSDIQALQTSIDNLNKEYGDIQNWIAQHTGANPADIQALQAAVAILSTEYATLNTEYSNIQSWRTQHMVNHPTTDTINSAIASAITPIADNILYETGVNYQVANAATIYTSCKNGDTLLIYCTYSGSHVYMPNLNDIRDVLNKTSLNNFRLRITVNNKYDSTAGFYLYPGESWGNYFRDWNGSDIDNYLLNKGDSMIFDCYYYNGSAWIQVVNELRS